jgi:hypothetical protein
MDRSKKLRKAVYTIDDTMKNKFPVNTKDAVEDEIAYCQKLMEVIEKEGSISGFPKVKEQLNLLKETVADDRTIADLRRSQMKKWAIRVQIPRFLDTNTHCNE